jgi:hypothetical protein
MQKIYKEDRANFVGGRNGSTFTSFFDRFMKSLCLSHRKRKTMRVEREVAFVAVIGGKGAGKSVQIQKNAAYMKIDLRSNVKK